jgi:predicted transcriptional regulator
VQTPAELLKVLTPARLALIGAVKTGSDSIAAIAERLHRDRASVSKDVEKLHMCGILLVENKVLAGHGRSKQVSMAARSMQLSA